MSIQEKNKSLVLEAFDTLFNKRDYKAAEKFWSPNYIQHGAHPMRLAQTDSLRRDQSSWNCRSAERCTSSRKLGHAAG